MDEVAPRSLVHGHWHARFRDGWDGLTSSGTEYRCEVIGLPEDGIFDNAITGIPEPGVGVSEVAVL